MTRTHYRHVRVEYDAAGGHLHRWTSGTGRFWLMVEPGATDEQIRAEAEAEAIRRARRNIEHNAAVSEVRILPACLGDEDA
ncbi:MAG: hypothetical protein EBR82_61785 [Caulobacteraceae bacterium]|nr:hypothetical protein [Caulobacteraceae bacterium]NCA12471.1 hypothetical protein [bacterium]